MQGQREGGGRGRAGYMCAKGDVEILSFMAAVCQTVDPRILTIPEQGGRGGGVKSDAKHMLLVMMAGRYRGRTGGTRAAKCKITMVGLTHRGGGGHGWLTLIRSFVLVYYGRPGTWGKGVDKYDICGTTSPSCTPRTCTLLLNVTVLRGVSKPPSRERSSAHSFSVVLRPRGTIIPPQFTMSAFDAPPQPPPPQFLKMFPHTSLICLRRLSGPGGPLTSVLVQSMTAAAAAAVMASSRP